MEECIMTIIAANVGPMNRLSGAAVGLALIAVFQSNLGWSQGATIKNEHFLQSSAEPDIKIYVRERLPSDADPARLDEAVLFVHGATYGGDTFDLELEGYDWMTQVAERGFATYYLDIHGYGRSTRPPAMSDPPERNEPFARAGDAVSDVADAVDFILERTGADKINLIGWSWGTVTTGMYTASNNDKVDRLVLYAPIYGEENPGFNGSMAEPGNPDQLKAIGAYAVDADRARQRWDSQILPEDKSAWREEEVFQTWFDALLATEPEGAKAVRAPNGVLVDLWEIFHARPVYDASAIQVPTLIIRGEADQDSTHGDAFGLFEKLGAANKLYVVIGNGTHFVSLEKQAPALIREVQAFLER
jgi:pimeloyl-ACP methyl ester carboxylesterase